MSKSGVRMGNINLKLSALSWCLMPQHKKRALRQSCDLDSPAVTSIAKRGGRLRSKWLVKGRKSTGGEYCRN